MFSHAFTLFGLLAFSSAGLLDAPSRLYLPATTTQGHTNTLTRTSQPVFHQNIQIPSVVTTSHQIPTVVSTINHQVPVTRTTAPETYTVNTVQPAQVHSVGVPTVVASTVSQQVPLTRTTAAQHFTVNTNTRSAQPAQIQTVNVPSVVSTVYQQVPTTRLTTGTSQVTSAVNTNTLLRTSQPAQINTVAYPSVLSTSSQQVPIRQIAIVRLANENIGDGTYSYNYETENGIAAQEHGQADVAGAETVERVHGSYSYTGPDNVRYTVNYVADENGYRAEGAHLPVPPAPVDEVPQVATRTSQINTNVNTQSAVTGVHVIPTTVISQPLQIVQTPGVQSQRQATSFQSSYQHQVPLIQSQHNTFRQVAVAPSATQTVHFGSTGYTQQTSNSLQSQQGVLQRQSTVVPSSSVTVQHGSTGYTTQQTGADSVQTQIVQRHSIVVPTTVTVQHGTTQQQIDAAYFQPPQVLQRQSAVVPSTFTFHQGTTGYSTQQIGLSGVQHGVVRQSAAQPTSTVTVQHGSTGYSTQQQTGVSSVQTKQGLLQRQAVSPSSVQQGTDYNTQQSVQTQQQVVQNQNTVVPGSVSVQQGTQQSQLGVGQNTVVPSNTATVQQQQQGSTTHQTGVSGAVQQGLVQTQTTVVPGNTVTVQQGVSEFTNQQSVSGAAQGLFQRQAVVPRGIVPVHLGRTGLIKQQTGVQGEQSTQHQTSGVSTSHVTVQLGTTGYTTEQVGDSSSVRILGGSSVQTTAVPSNNLNVQQVNHQSGVSEVQSQQVVPNPAVVPVNNVSGQQTTNQETNVSQQSVVLPDGTVHYGY